MADMNAIKNLAYDIYHGTVSKDLPKQNCVQL